MLSLAGGSMAQKAARIVSLGASVTKNIYLLKGEDCLVGCTQFCATDPADSIPVVADAVNINLEKIALLEPDLVIATGLTHPRTIDALERIGVRTVRLNQPRNFEEICEQLDQLGEYTGRKEVAYHINEDCRRRMKLVEQQWSAMGQRPKVFMQIGADPLFTALDNTFMHDYIVQAGGENIAGGMTNGIVTREFVLMQDPDVIIITAMGVLTEEEKKNWEKITNLKAVKNKRILVFDDGICSPTPIVFVETVEEMIRTIGSAK